MKMPGVVRPAVLTLTAWLTAALALPAVAGEMLVQGRIIDVVPIDEPQWSVSGGAACEPRPPESRADLTALLAWDLRTQCNGRRAGRPAGTDAVSGYRVYYRWDGRTYQHVVRQPPAGDTISLRVRVD